MNEYIERERLLRRFNIDDMMNVNGTLISLEDARNTISNFPAADVEPVKYGRWEPVLEDVWNLPTPVLVGWRCSQCGRTEQEKEPYCNCGAKMDCE